MIISRPFLISLFVGSATAAQSDFLKSIEYDSDKRINITEYYHAPDALYDDMLEGYFSVLSEKRWAAREISINDVTLFWKPSIGRLTFGKVKKSVYFLTHFLAPLIQEGVHPDDNIVIYLTFTHDPTVEFEIDPDIIAKPHVEELPSRSGINHRDVPFQMKAYKVTCRPGGVLPIRIIVFNLRPGKYFRMLWSWDPLDTQKLLSPRLVKLLPPRKEISCPNDLMGYEPMRVPDGNPYSYMLLRPSLPTTSIRNYALGVYRNTTYILEGYFRPHLVCTRFVLSGEVGVNVKIALASLPRDIEFTNSVIVAGKGFATKTVEDLEPGMLYRITILSYLGKRDYAGFTLQISDPDDDEMNSSDMVLLIPREKPKVQGWPQQAPGAGRNKFRNHPHYRAGPLAELLTNLNPSIDASYESIDGYGLAAFTERTRLGYARQFGRGN